MTRDELIEAWRKLPNEFVLDAIAPWHRRKFWILVAETVIYFLSKS